ncbi:Major facilitator family transporter [Myxococcus hansupus]|uniref:Major facilitator family transporter n=1 Tax=Pseudomyxococcus hansupus TaxID=1297742 RepID=A0A0H4WSM2_9BACT|nr:flagellar biosynthetic protein FliO [Myxococcus hansupus]AKQ64355.1 Major facilitator family transporter [Myxococcus hansupus]
MNARRWRGTPRSRLMVAGALLLGLAVMGPVAGVSSVAAARWMLGAVALAALGWWLHRRGGAVPGAVAEPRLNVVSRAGLSQRCGLALVEVDGRSYLVAFGDAFAEIRETPSRRSEFGQVLAQARRPMPKPRKVRGRRVTP